MSQIPFQDVPRIPYTEFWEQTIEANPQSEPLINSVTAGTLYAFAESEKFEVVLGQFSGLGKEGHFRHGAANMMGSPLPPLPEDGLFEITFTTTTCQLIIKDYAGFIITVWNGAGTETGLEGTHTGNWIRLNH